MGARRDITVVPALNQVLLFVQDLDDRVAPLLKYLFFALNQDDDLVELPENCRVVM